MSSAADCRQDGGLLFRPKDAVAIVGMACRFPQEAESTTRLWDLLLHGRSARTEFPEHKMNIDAHYHPEPTRAGSMSCRHGHFLKESGHMFDAPFFNITKTEALAMDPQQRLLMENVYEALENAGISIDSVTGTETSVFVGAFTNDYHSIINMDPEMPLKYAPTGNSNSILSNRVSWFYDLKGPSLTLDTACSSSLVAVHLACQSLKEKTSTMSIVGGVNVIEHPQALYRMSTLGFLSPDGKCYSFDHRANGYSRGEGVGVVVLKPLHDALRDGDCIRGVIRSTGINQDGRTPGMTLPSKHAQEKLVRSVYDSAGLDLSLTSYVEAHGTGTAQGDPIEAGAIASAWSERKTNGPLYVGAIKSNIGHLEGASGVAGVIKSVLVLEKGLIPPNINFEEINPKITPEKWNLKFPTEPTSFPDLAVRRASVNSFGFGGTNAHVVIDDAYNFLRANNLLGHHRSVSQPPVAGAVLRNGSGMTPEPENHVDSNNDRHAISSSGVHDNGKVFVFSSFDESGVKRASETYSQHLSSLCDVNEEEVLADLAYTLASKRTMFSWKGFAVAASLDELVRRLPDVVKTVRNSRRSTPPKIGFVFTGQGAQWHGMGRDLLIYPAFRDSLEESGVYLRRLGSPWDLLEELSLEESESNINDPAVSQAACTALQVALVDLLATWGIQASCVIGHSSGEIAAAYAAGALAREFAWGIAYFRGVVSAKLAGSGGAMLAAGVDADSLQDYLREVDQELPGELTMACFNSPRNITVSGDERKIDRLEQLLNDKGVFNKRLSVRNAYHSNHMKPGTQEYLELVKDVLQRPQSNSDKRHGSRPFFSTVTGAEVSVAELQSAEYWVTNLVSPVRFSDALQKMCFPAEEGRKKLHVDRGSKGPLQHLLEIGPHPALQSASRDTLSLHQATQTVDYSYLVHNKEPGVSCTLQTAGKLFCSGYPVDLTAVNMAESHGLGGKVSGPRMLVDLPSYPFNHDQEYWPESRLSKNFRFRKQPRHDLLGAPVPDWRNQDPAWRHTIRVSENPWLKDHRVTGRILYPGVGFLIMAVEAARQLSEAEGVKVTGFRLRDVAIISALQVPETEDGIETVFSMPSTKESNLGVSGIWRDFKLLSYNPSTDDWREHCRGMISTEHKTHHNPGVGGQETELERQAQLQKFEEYSNTCKLPHDMVRSYSELETVGLSFGPLFKNLTDVTKGGNAGVALGTVCVPDVAESMPMKFTHPHIIHPATMDSMLHVFLAAAQDLIGVDRLAEPMVPVAIKEIWVARDMANEPRSKFRTHAVAARESYNRFVGSIDAWDPETKSPKIRFQDVQFVPLQSDSSSHLDRQLGYAVRWAPDIDLLDNLQVENHVKRDLRADKHSVEAVTKMAQAFNLATVMYGNQALKELENDKLDDLPEHLQKYLTWMKHQQAQFQKGLVLHQVPEWNTVMRMSSLREKLVKEIEKTGPEARMAIRIGSNLVSILRREADALQLMFEDNLLDAYYQEVHGTETIHHYLRSYLDVFSLKHSNLRVLEIGAGTGGTTLPVLEALAGINGLSRLARYTYTDISPGFFEKAKAKFRSWNHIIDFRKLDIEQDPTAQDFEEGQYDVVIAANVLHATRNLERTLGNVRRLLRAGGKLLLQEAVNLELLSGGLIFGTLPGWWLGEEENRQLGPLLKESQWDEQLRKAGFSGADISLRDHDDDGIHAQSLIISTSPEPTQPPILPEATTGLFCPASLHGLAVEVKASLEARGVHSVEIITDYCGLERFDLKEMNAIVLDELGSPVFPTITEDQFATVRRLLTTCRGVLWIKADAVAEPGMALSTGILRSLRWERDLDGSNLVILAFDKPTQELLSIPSSYIASNVSGIYGYQFLQDGQQRNAEYMVSDNVVLINRLVNAPSLDDFLVARTGKAMTTPQPFRSDPTRCLKLSTGCPGLLNRLQFVDCDVYSTDLEPDDVEVEIRATGLNFRDVMSAMGEVRGDTLGAEGAGIVSRIGKMVKDVNVGDRVAILASRTGCFQTFARTVSVAVAKIPDALSFEEAAALPVVACTAYYCLVDLARLRSDESVLIHAAAGGVGQAAVMLARHVGAEIFATVSTEEKKDILMETYGIPEDHIFSSRDLVFSKGIMRLTKNRGVDVILNSLSGEALRVSWDCIAPFGRFVEIGKRDIYSNRRLDMFPFSRNVTFASCDLETVMRLDQKTTARLLRDTMKCWEEGVFTKPNPLNIFPYSKMEECFRLLQSGNHIGKVVLTANPGDLVPVIPRPHKQYRLRADASYVLSGGLGGLGRSTARWMVSRGARNLIFLSRNGASSEAAQQLLQELEAGGCQAMAFSCDVSNSGDLHRALSESSGSMPPIRGCIQGAMQLKDSAFETMQHREFMAAVAPKVQGSWNLHEQLPRDMDFFIMLSSICGIIGNRGQSNYAAGNTYQDALAEYRKRNGVPGTSIDLGSMLSVGFIAEHQDTLNPYALAVKSIREDEFHAVLEYCMNAAMTEDAQVAVGLATRAAFMRKGIPEPSFLNYPLFTLLQSSSDGSLDGGEERESFAATRAALQMATTLEEASAIVLEAVVRRLASVMATAPEDVDTSKPIHFYGVDSLVAVEFRNWLNKNMAADVDVLDIMGDESMAKLSENIAKVSKLVKLDAQGATAA
ncbi:hypothetical protein GQ53DRAFT_891722 [Thozetella sp. PMI_491]|nr:hypothetical protein GQ53DRAFT_891722 [Thozetella sp. PMI_491]